MIHQNVTGQKDSYYPGKEQDEKEEEEKVTIFSVEVKIQQGYVYLFLFIKSVLLDSMISCSYLFYTNTGETCPSEMVTYPHQKQSGDFD